MKNSISYYLFIIFFLAMSSKCERPNDSSGIDFKFIKTDKKVSKFLGKASINLLNTADSIKVYLLDPLDTSSVHPRQFGYSVLKESFSLDSTQMVAFHKIIKNEKNYSFDNYAKNCSFSPNYLISIYKSNKVRQDTLSVLLDFNCDVWQIKYLNTIKSEDNEMARDSLISWLTTIFSKNNSAVKPTTGDEILDPALLEQELISSISDCILKSDSIVSYILNPEKKSENKSELFNNYSIIDKPLILDKKFNSRLITIVSSKENFKTRTISKNCTFLPDIGFRFFKKGEKCSDIMIAFYCDEWCFINDKHEFFRDSKLVRQALLDIIREIYPNDEYFKKL